ncbi:MAG: hemolysin family protein [Bacillota bacterium]
MDDPGGSTYRLLIIAVLLAFSALFSGSETALFSLNPVRVRQMREKGNRSAQLIETLLCDGSRVLSSLLIGNTMVNIWLTSLVTTGLLALLGGSYGAQVASLLATVIATVLLLVFGEVTPKAIATANAEGFASRVAKPVHYAHFLLRPLVFAADLVTGGFSVEQEEPLVTEEIIKTAVNIGEEEGSLRQEDREMIYGIFASDDTPVSRVMVPRERIVALPLGASIDEVITLLSSEGYSRLPVYRGDLDHVVGLLYAKDLLIHLHQRKTTKLENLIRPVLRCRPSRRANQLLSEMRQKRAQLCLVVSENGQTLGLVTLEDLMEQIVGEIEDEYDVVEAEPMEVAVC